MHQKTPDNKNEQQETVQKKDTTNKQAKTKKAQSQHSEHTYQSKEGVQEPPPATYGRNMPVQTKQSQKGVIQSKEGKKAPIQARHRPVQRVASKAQHIAHTMGEQYNVDTSKLQLNENSSFPGTVNAEATIQGNRIDFAPGKASEENIKHEVGHHIINTQRGTPPKADKVVNGQAVNTSDEAAADRIAAAPLQRKCTTCEAGGMQRKKSAHVTSSAVQRKCSKCEKEEKLKPKTVQRKAVARPLPAGLPLQRKCTHCEAKENKGVKRKKSPHNTEASVQRNCPDCEAKDKLNTLTGIDPLTKDKDKEDSSKNNTENTKDTPVDNGNSPGEVIKTPVVSESPKANDLVGGDNSLVASSITKKSGDGKTAQKPLDDKHKKDTGKKDEKAGTENKGKENAAKEAANKSGGNVPDKNAGGDGSSATARQEIANANLATASEQLTSLEPVGFKLPENSSQNPEKRGQMQHLQAQAEGQAHSFFNQAVGQVSNIFGLSGSISGGIQQAQVNAETNIQNAAATQKAAIIAKSQQAIATAQAKAATSRAQINAQYAATSAGIQVKTQGAKAQMEAEYQAALQALDTKKTDQIAQIEAIYNQGDHAYREAGRKVAQLALAQGQQRKAAFKGEMLFDKDGEERRDSLTEGYLTNRRAKAKMKAAEQVAQAYSEGLLKEAHTQADEAVKGKVKDIEGVHAAIAQAQTQLKQHYEGVEGALDSQQTQALAQARQTKEQLLDGIEQNLQTTVASLKGQQNTQTTAIDKGTAAQISQLNQQSQTTIATLLDMLGRVALGLSGQLAEMRKSLQGLTVTSTKDLTILTDSLGATSQEIAFKVEETMNVFAEKTGEAATGIDSTQKAAAVALQTVGTKAATGLDTTLKGFEQGAAAMTQAGVKNLQTVGKGYNTAVDQLSKAAKQGFDQLVAQIQKSFDLLSANLEQALTQSVPNLEKGLQDALGEKGSTDEKKMHGLIAKKAAEAASKEQPAWKSIVKWVLIIAVVVVVALVAGPAVIGAVGAFAATMGASAAAAGIIGAVVGGAIVGAATSATIQVINNWGAGEAFFKGVGKAALTGAIGGALGAGVGLAINGMSSVVGKFVIETLADVVVDLGTKVAFGDIQVADLGKLDTWKQIGLDALTSIAFSLGTNALTSKRVGGNRVERWQQRGTNLGNSLGVKMGGTIPKPNVKADVSTPKTETETPKIPDTPEVKVEKSTPKVEEAKVEKSTPKVEEAKVEKSTPKVEETKVEKSTPKVEETKVEKSTPKTETAKVPEVKEKLDIRTKNEVPDGGSSNRRSTHENRPEVEKGGIVARHKTEDGHTVKVLVDGRIIVCSVCGDLRMRYAEQLADTTLRNRLDAIEKIADPDVKAQQAKDLRTDLETIGTNTALVKTGNELAKGADLPDAPQGYFWKRGKDGAVHLFRLPSKINEVPRIIYDPDAPKVAGVPDGFKVEALTTKQYQALMSKVGGKKKAADLIAKTKNITRLADIFPKIKKNSKKFAQLLDTVQDLDHILKMNDEFLLALAKSPKLMDALIAEPTLAHQRMIRANKILKDHRLFKNMGTASHLEMALMHVYTESSNFVNFPMRGGHPEDVLDLHKVDYSNYPNHSSKVDADFAIHGQVKLEETFNKLAQTSRLVENKPVFRGRSYEKNQFEALFANAKVGDEIPLKGYQSASRTVDTPLAFLDKTVGDYKVIIEIEAKKGVDIDDIADYGKTLGPIHHPKEKPEVQVQQEVLLKEGNFEMVSPPKMTNIKGRDVYLVVLRELVTPLNRKK